MEKKKLELLQKKKKSIHNFLDTMPQPIPLWLPFLGSLFSKNP